MKGHSKGFYIQTFWVVLKIPYFWEILNIWIMPKYTTISDTITTQQFFVCINSIKNWKGTWLFIHSVFWDILLRLKQQTDAWLHFRMIYIWYHQIDCFAGLLKEEAQRSGRGTSNCMPNPQGAVQYPTIGRIVLGFESYQSTIINFDRTSLRFPSSD